jgi:hypothetical protein
MSETAILGIAGIIGTLVGVWLGYVLQQGAESRRQLKEAGARLAANALEAVEHMKMSEDARASGLPPEPLRPEFRSEQYLGWTTVSLVSKKVATAAADLNEVIQDAIEFQTSGNPKERQMGRDAVFLAIQAFEGTVRRETDSPWGRIKRGFSR